jgi:glycosyltransferase involved in cell wall biosynthesis
VKIVMLSDHETLGGAAQAASRLATALCREHEVVRLVLFPDGTPHPWRTHVLGAESRLARWAKRIPRKLGMRGFAYPGTSAFARQQLFGVIWQHLPCVVNVHNLHGGTDWGWTASLVGVCANLAPVVWTLHDMWSFTGRCAYAYDCEKFTTGCDATCPTPHESPRLAAEHIAAAWHERQHMLAPQEQCLFDRVAVTPSRWLAGEAQRGLWAGHRVEVIPYGVPTEVFVPIARDEARRRLGVAADGPVLLLAAYDLTERRKGAEILPRLWRAIRHRPLTVLTVGNGGLEVDDPHVRVEPLGWIEDDRTKALAYSAADVLVHPAPVDNFPNTLLEAFACGTPAVGLPIGGVREQIRDGVSGWLAAGTSAEALGRAVDEAIARRADLRATCRELAVREYGMALQAQRYCQLFEALCKECVHV